MPKEIMALMTARGYVICGSGCVSGELSLEGYKCKTYEVDHKVVCIASG